MLWWLIKQICVGVIDEFSFGVDHGGGGGDGMVVFWAGTTATTAGTAIFWRGTRRWRWGCQVICIFFLAETKVAEARTACVFF